MTTASDGGSVCSDRKCSSCAYRVMRDKIAVVMGYEEWDMAPELIRDAIDKVVDYFYGLKPD